ncbi:hypothetical protein [Streptomyces rhizosphaericus]|uniref:Uncharacterized protein n=1 Tax=Streptomyces rhizosphaericus TaxID=114699 RepID=A0ABN1S3V9_9ACTN|nr:hypothetical protein [Streptomyces indonesiensis]
MSTYVASWGDEPWSEKIHQVDSRAIDDRQDHGRAVDDQHAKIWVIVLILIIPLVGSGYVAPELALQALSLLVALFHGER